MVHSIFLVAAFKEHFDVSFRFSFGQSIVQVAPSSPFPRFQVVVEAKFSKPLSRPLLPETLPVHLAVSHVILHFFIRLVLGQVRSVLGCDKSGDFVGDRADDAAGLASHLAFSFSGRDHSILPSAFLEHFVVSFKLPSSGHDRTQLAPSGPSGTFQVVVETPLLLPVSISLPKPPEHVTFPQLILHLLTRVLGGHLVPVLGPATGGVKVLEGDVTLVVICGENVPL